MEFKTMTELQKLKNEFNFNQLQEEIKNLQQKLEESRKRVIEIDKKLNELEKYN